MESTKDESKDFYEIIGVARDADRQTIQKAYRKLARKYHPDLNPGDKGAEERFKKIASAWAVLSDDSKRSSYDEFGEISLEAGFDAENARKRKEAFGAEFGTRGRDHHGATDGEFHFGDIDDLFGRMYSREGHQQSTFRLRGADLEASLELDFLEAVRGGEKTLSLSRQEPGGAASVDSVTIRIPPGVNSNGRLRIPGKGSPGIGGGEAGDLWVALRVRPHRVFRREGNNLTLDLPISVREAILGAQVDVPTLDGRATLTVPLLTDSGARLRLRGKGVPSQSGRPAGDLLVRVQIKVPEKLDDETEALLDAIHPFEDPEIRKELFS
ncbi:MAG: DnaJ-class molecular chaperone [Myxococcota bacterium]|jgi:DnaJ-class molecular chaperone